MFWFYWFPIHGEIFISSSDVCLEVFVKTHFQNARQPDAPCIVPRTAQARGTSTPEALQRAFMLTYLTSITSTM